MFDIGWSELLLIGVVALIAIGPKELPGVLRAVGQWTTKIRRMAAEFQGQFQEALREAEMADLKKQVDELNDTARSFTNFDPLAETPKPASPAPTTTEASASEPVAALPGPEPVTSPEPTPSVEPPAAAEQAPVAAASPEPVAGAAAVPAEMPSVPVPDPKPHPLPEPAPAAVSEAPIRNAGEATPSQDRPA
ncbi:Sec-independent protein translocase protein TatB [Rhodoplanes roseus]|uniref:Sec-independent protein translocase protein TatB n=1 Tax=Rhodoplanes roseus TaxID=29409 RepID=A0A327LD12_9BRAD|nr:Sec-independent protein translocase protein TatB [Rhodoplanes roseus]RAI45698.1 twin-arginine translocase subunit TatB [Rhodoplanes roseus]